MVNYEGLIHHLNKHDENFGLLTMQATSTTGRLMRVFPRRFKCLFSAEQGFFGTGEATGAWHSYWNRPIHSLCGAKAQPTDEMFEGLGRIVIDLCDIGIRRYPYLSTMKNVIEACAARHVPVTILDRPVPLGGILDGPMVKPEFISPLAPINVPFCHGMTPGECAEWIRRTEGLDIDLTVIRLTDWSHSSYEPWPNFVPPSETIRSWDCATMYPMTVFTEAYPAIDCDLGGALAYRVIGAPWMDQMGIIADLSPELKSCGVGMRPYRYSPLTGKYRGHRLNGILFTVANYAAFYPVTAAALVFAALLQRHGVKVLAEGKPKLLDQLTGSAEVRETFEKGDLGVLFQSWIDAQDEYLKTKVDLYV